MVICAGGGGIPTMYPSPGRAQLVGVEAVIDKDLASELLAEDVGADLFLMATDVDGVYLDWGTPEARGWTGCPPRNWPATSSRPGPWARRSRPRPVRGEHRPAGRDRRAG